jgi:osmoprotectant transport system permease protein
MGMSGFQILWRIELPLALPVIVAGLRIATVTVIGITAIATYISAGGLGNLLSEGVSTAYNEEIEAGVFAIVVLALLADLLLRLIEAAAARYSGRDGVTRLTR